MIDITIYRITGQQFLVTVPSAWCEECDLTINMVKKVLAELGIGKGDKRVRVTIKPFVEFAVQSLSKGGWHPPVLLINGQIFSQGVVPEREKLAHHLETLLSKEKIKV
jgi:hypothetical protein